MLLPQTGARLLGALLFSFNALIIIFNGVYVKVILTHTPSSRFTDFLFGLALLDLFKALVPFNISAIYLLKEEQIRYDSLACYISGWSFMTFYLSTSAVLLVISTEVWKEAQRKRLHDRGSDCKWTKCYLFVLYVVVALYSLISLTGIGKIVPGEYGFHCEFDYTDESSGGRILSLFTLCLGWLISFGILILVTVAYRTMSISHSSLKATEFQNAEPEATTVKATKQRKASQDLSCKVQEKLSDTIATCTMNETSPWKMECPLIDLFGSNKQDAILINLSLVFLFWISWIPHLGYITIIQFGDKTFASVLAKSSVCSTVINSILNPFVPFLISKWYRRNLLLYLLILIPEWMLRCSTKLRSIREHYVASLAEVDPEDSEEPRVGTLAFHNDYAEVNSSSRKLVARSQLTQTRIAILDEIKEGGKADAVLWQNIEAGPGSLTSKVNVHCESKDEHYSSLNEKEFISSKFKKRKSMPAFGIDLISLATSTPRKSEVKGILDPLDHPKGRHFSCGDLANTLVMTSPDLALPRRVFSHKQDIMIVEAFV